MKRAVVVLLLLIANALVSSNRTNSSGFVPEESPVSRGAAETPGVDQRAIVPPPAVRLEKIAFNNIGCAPPDLAVARP